MRTDHGALLGEIERDWAHAGLTGSLLARNLASGAELGFGPDAVWPLASVIKLPIAVVVHDAFESGHVLPDEMFEIDPDRATSGPTGVSLFRHPSRIAAEDLVQLSLAVSDNAATDLLLERIGVSEVTARLARMGAPEIAVRHLMRTLYGVSGAMTDVGLGLAAGGRTPGGGHLISELDPHRANVGTARGLLDLLDRLWTDRISSPSVCARIRCALGRQLVRHRLAVELAADDTRVRSKTGTFLELRHEVGVVETEGEAPIAVVALTRSEVAASEQLEADFAIGHAARTCVDALR